MAKRTIRLPKTDMLHYRLLKNWRDKYRASLVEQYRTWMELGQFHWDNMVRYADVCREIRAFREQGRCGRQ